MKPVMPEPKEVPHQYIGGVDDWAVDARSGLAFLAIFFAGAFVGALITAIVLYSLK